MFADIYDELGGRGMSVLLGLMLGGMVTWLFSRWKRMRQRQSIQAGDARDTVVINMHIVESAEQPGPDGRLRRVPTSLRIRSLGQEELCRVVPNGHLATVLLHRAFQVTSRDTLISMTGAEGSFLLETLTNFVCDRVANDAFGHDFIGSGISAGSFYVNNCIH